MGRIIEKRLITKDDPIFNEGVSIIHPSLRGCCGLTPGLIRGWSRWKKEQEAKRKAETGNLKSEVKEEKRLEDREKRAEATTDNTDDKQEASEAGEQDSTAQNKHNSDD